MHNNFLLLDSYKSESLCGLDNSNEFEGWSVFEWLNNDPFVWCNNKWIPQYLQAVISELMCD